MQDIAWFVGITAAVVSVAMTTTFPAISTTEFRCRRSGTPVKIVSQTAGGSVYLTAFYSPYNL